MGIDYEASLGYGFPIPDSIKWEGVEEIVTSYKGADFIWHGNAYVGTSLPVVVFSDSISKVWSCDDLEPIKLNLNQSWDEKLKKIAKELGIDKPKIGWYLCANVS